jgi:hypothetical protein
MTTTTNSSHKQVILPADIRWKLNLMAGVVTAPAKGKARSLSDFDPASLLKKSK